LREYDIEIVIAVPNYIIHYTSHQHLLGQSWICSKDGADKKCIQKFGVETDLNEAAQKTEKEIRECEAGGSTGGLW
jgi:hypothetical protein